MAPVISDAMIYKDTATPDRKNPVRNRAIMRNQNESANADNVAVRETIARQQNITDFLPNLKKEK